MSYCIQKKKRFVPVFARAGQSELQQEKLPLEVAYSTDYNIVELDRRITKLLTHTKQEVDDVNEELRLLQSEIDIATSVVSLKHLQARQKKLETRYDDLVTNKRQESYKNRTSEYLSIYADMHNDAKRIDATRLDSYKLTDEEKKKERVVDQYLSIAASFVEMKITKQTLNIIDECSQCGASLYGVLVSESGHRICPNPTCEVDNHLTKIQGLPPKEYDPYKNFLKAHKRYIGGNKGVFSTELLETLMSDLDSYFTQKGEKDGAYYRALPLNERGRKDGTSHEAICKAFKQLGYEYFYKYYMYICHVYYGWNLPDLAGLEEQIERNFRAKQEIWDSMSSDERGGQSSLSTQYRLCREYQHVGYECDLSEFKVSRKIKTVSRYDRAYSIMCTRSGFKFPHL